MPLKSRVIQLNRTNCIQVLLASLESNRVVKALIFLPGATDELYLLQRVHAELTNNSPTLLDAVTALTTQTPLRATFRPPFLLLHSATDPLEPANTIRDQATWERLTEAHCAPHLVCFDRDWEYLQPLLHQALTIDVRPWRASQAAWHFYRHNFAAWNLNGREALEAIAWAGKSKFKVRRKQVVFELDPRHL